jgi:hypothetical protein
MTPKLLRFAYVCEFLLALAAIFTAWPEIGGEAALELMHWGFKLGFGITLAACAVGYTKTIVAADRIVTWRSVGWWAAIALLAIGMGVVTYYYTLEEESGEADEPSGTVTIYYPCTPITGAYS